MRLIIDHKRFFYQKSSKAFTAEISELREWKPGDAIHLKGKKEIVTYGASLRVIDIGEGEIGGWELFPSDAEVKRVPACKGTRVVIFND